MRFEDRAEIGAPAGTVWDLTERIEHWPDFLPTIRSVRPLVPGPLAIGSRVRIEQPAQPAATWTITRLQPPEHLERRRPFLWLTMVASHRIEEIDGSTCRNVLAVELEGRWAGVAGGLVGAGIRHALAAESEAFARRATED